MESAPDSPPRLIPTGACEYAKRWKAGRLDAVTFPGEYAADADDEELRPYLAAVAEGKEEEAIGNLAHALACAPTRLWHPYAQSQLLHLFFRCLNPDLPGEFRDRANSAIVNLIEAWCIGMGYVVEVKRTASRRGQTPNLFPLIDEREGLLSTPEATEERRAASNFIALYKDLVARLKRIRWKHHRNEYRAARPAGKSFVIGDAISELKPVLQQLERDHGLPGTLPPVGRLEEMVRQVLAVKKGRNPREQFAYEYLGEFDFVIGGVERPTTPSLIKSTIRTLARRGIRS